MRPHRTDRDRETASLLAYAEGYTGADDRPASQIGDGRPYQGTDRPARYAGEPDARRGCGPTIRDREPHRDDGRPIVTGAPRSLPVQARPASGMGPMVPALAPVRDAAIIDVLAGAPESAIARIAARGDRLDAAHNTTTSGPDLVRAMVSIARGDWHGFDGVSATARRVTQALRAENAPSAKYADRPEVTGALVTPKMRVRHSLRSHAGAMGAPVVSTDGSAARIEAARGKACEALRVEIRAYHRARARREDTGRIRARIVQILDAWGQDSAIIETARAEGWQIK